MSEAVKKIFAESSPTYDLVNRLLTFGLDAFWRKQAARLAARGGGQRWLDVCSGTGDMARALRREASPAVRVLAADFSLPMLRLAGPKARLHPFDRVCAELPRLPFPDEAFDLVTMSFATRNINTSRTALLACLREFHRLLKSGGRLVNLETSQPRRPWVRKIFHAYVRTAVRRVGRAVSGSRLAYAYLASTIPRFYDAPSLSTVLREAGFRRVTYEHRLFGVAALHLAVK